MLISTFLNLIAEKLQMLTKRKTKLILIFFFILVILLNGVAIMPHEQYLVLSQNPFVTYNNSGNYAQESILLPLLAFYFHLVSNTSFYLFCFFILLLAYFLFSFFTYRHYENSISLVFISTIIASPITTVLFAWVGSPDGITFALSIPFLFISSPIAMFVLALFGTTNHIMMLISASEILFLRWISQEKIRIIHIVVTIIGGTIGYVFVRLFLQINSIDLKYSRLTLPFSMSFANWLDLNLLNFPKNLFSLFNIQWLIILFCVIMFFNKNKKYFSAVLLIILVNFGITFFTIDTTRVFSILSWGVLMHCIFYSYRIASKEQNPLFQKQFFLGLIIIGLISIISPRYFIWEGAVYNSLPFHEFIKNLLPR